MIKKIDPVYLLLQNVVLARFIRGDITREERCFVFDNIEKHRRAMWINLICSTLVVWGLFKAPKDHVDGLIAALLGPVLVFGGAWFALSFGGIPKRIIDVAMSITFWMFMAFLTSMTTMFLVVAYVSPFPFWPVLALIYCAAYVACVQFDTADGFKAGLDEANLNCSRATLTYLEKKHGIVPDQT